MLSPGTDLRRVGESFTERLRAEADPLWEAQHQHPFVRSIADGSLSATRWRRWVEQDHAFLVDYCRLLALGAARAPDLETMRGFVGLLHSTATTEMALHRRLAADLGIDEAALAAVQPAPALRGYADFLLRTATLGDVAVLAGALLPCMWAFSEIGERLAAQGPPAEPRCRSWVEGYAAAEFAAQAAWCRDLVDRLVAGSGAPLREAVREAFLVSSRHEIAFWDAVWGAAP